MLEQVLSCSKFFYEAGHFKNQVATDSQKRPTFRAFGKNDEPLLVSPPSHKPLANAQTHNTSGPHVTIGLVIITYSERTTSATLKVI